MKLAHSLSTVCMPIAGQGKRLGETGLHIPKCLLMFQGETLLDYAISLMKRAGIANFVFIVGNLKEQLLSHIESNHTSLNAVIVEQAKRKGIVHAVCCARKQLEGKPFVIYCPDNYFADYYDLRRCINFWTPSIGSAVLTNHTDMPRRNRGLLYAPFARHPGEALGVERIEPSNSTGWMSTGFSVEGFDFFQHADKITPRDGEKRLFDLWHSELQSGKTVVAVPLEGKVFDISNQLDVDTLHDALMSPAEGVAVILRTPDNKFLLMKRDKKAGIRYPGYWALFGGSVDLGETTQDAACREIEEELELRISPGDVRKVTQYFSNMKREYVYAATLTRPIESLTLREGQSMQLFDISRLAELDIRDDDRQALFTYLQQEHLQ
ncbi:NUDIX domain-containing protein [Desulfococcaceae bacterium HSG9]|nr:NUDIX domain-containing protein [Desulfococcaceae bacterium HSG9]